MSKIQVNLIGEHLELLRHQFQTMPPVAAMQITVQGLDAGRLRLQAPLQANLNDKANAFGGSLASMMTLASWGWLSLHLGLSGHDADVYVADSQLRYLQPVYEDLQASAAPEPEADWEEFLNALSKRGKARIQMQAQVELATGQAAAIFSGRFVAIIKA